MTQLTPAVDAALAGPAPTVFGAVRLTLPSATVRLIDGSGILAFGGETFVGRDPTYGAIAACENLSDGMGDTAPAFGLTLLPASDAAAADLASPAMQGSKVAVYVGVIDPATGIVVADPLLIFLGELDVPTLTSTSTGRELDYAVVSVIERCFVDDEGQRLSPGRQRAIYAGDAGLDDVTGVAQTINWGVAGPNVGVYVPIGGGGGAFAYNVRLQ